jgi:sirohydrochlorin ferrochelatase
VKALLLVSHGSRSPQARREVDALAKVLKEKSGFPIVQTAFLDVETPDIPEGISLCANRGAAEIIVLMNFVNSGNHVMVDVPALVEQSARAYPTLKFRITPHIGGHPKIPDLFLDFLNDFPGS